MSWMSGRDFSAWIISSFERRWQYTALVSGLFLAVDGRAARNNCRSRHIAIHKNRMTSASAASGAARAGSETSVCVVDGRGKIVKEAKVASEPEALVCFFKKLGVPVNRIGLEAAAICHYATMARHEQTDPCGLTLNCESDSYDDSEMAGYRCSVRPRGSLAVLKALTPTDTDRFFRS